MQIELVLVMVLLLFCCRCYCCCHTAVSRCCCCSAMLCSIGGASCINVCVFVRWSVFLRCGNEEALFGFCKRKQFSFRMKQCERPTKRMCKRIYVFMRELMCLVSTAKKGFNNNSRAFFFLFYFINGHAHRKCELWWCIWRWWYAIKKLLLYVFLCIRVTHKGFLRFERKKTYTWKHKLPYKHNTIITNNSNHGTRYFFPTFFPHCHPLNEFLFFISYMCRHAPIREKNHSYLHPQPARKIHSFIHWKSNLLTLQPKFFKRKFL